MCAVQRIVRRVPQVGVARDPAQEYYENLQVADQGSAETLSTYIHKNTIDPLFTGVGVVANFGNSIVLRFNGYEAELQAAIAPIIDHGNSPMIARSFFEKKLNSVVALSARYPAYARKVVDNASVSMSHPWGNLLKISVGDSTALPESLAEIELLNGNELRAAARCVASVARYRPAECRQLLAKIFDRADNNTTRLELIESVVNNPMLGNKAVLGDLFIKLMARSTPQERRTEIYPQLAKIIAANPIDPRRGFLRALLYGWITEEKTLIDPLRTV